MQKSNTFKTLAKASVMPEKTLEDLQRLNDELENRVQKAEDISRILKEGMCESRMPLTSMIFRTEYVLERDGDKLSQRGRKRLEKVYHYGKRALTLIDNLHEQVIRNRPKGEMLGVDGMMHEKIQFAKKSMGRFVSRQQRCL